MAPSDIKRVEAMIAPRGGAAAMYYTRPSEDLKRPGRTWYPTLGKTRFPLWGEVSTAYHEGVPGHHLQLAQFVYLAKTLSRFQRVAASVPGISEGWALYAERLMGELGYFDNPDYELGMLRAQAFRAMRVIVDIGGHLQLEIPRQRGITPANGGHRTYCCRSLSSMATKRRTFSEVKSIATWAGLDRRSATRSASVSGSRFASAPGRPSARSSISRPSTHERSILVRWGWPNSSAKWPIEALAESA